MVPTSIASAIQRAGRAGRTSSGICYRLYPFTVFQSLPRTTSPEITRIDLTTPLLQLKSLGIDDLMKFEWVTAPPTEIVLRALEGLVAAGMIGEDGRLTPVGEQVAECPVEVNIARMVCDRPCCRLSLYEYCIQLFNSKEFKCGEEILTIAAMTSVQVSGLIFIAISLMYLVPPGGRMYSLFLMAALQGPWQSWNVGNSLPRKG